MSDMGCMAIRRLRFGVIAVVATLAIGRPWALRTGLGLLCVAFTVSDVGTASLMVWTKAVSSPHSPKQYLGPATLPAPEPCPIPHSLGLRPQLGRGLHLPTPGVVNSYPAHGRLHPLDIPPVGLHKTLCPL